MHNGQVLTVFQSCFSSFGRNRKPELDFRVQRLIDCYLQNYFLVEVQYCDFRLDFLESVENFEKHQN